MPAVAGLAAVGTLMDEDEDAEEKAAAHGGEDRR